MIELLRRALSQTLSDELPVQQEAILLLALLIEKHSPRRDSQTYYDTMLPPEWLSISLSEESLNELVHEIGRIVLSSKTPSSLVWALTKSTSLDALEYLLAFLASAPAQNDQHGVKQALYGIDVFLSASPDDPLHDPIFGLSRKYNLKGLLEGLSGDCEEDIKKTVERIKQKLQ